MTGDVVGWWCWASPSGGLTDLTGNWDVFLIDCERGLASKVKTGRSLSEGPYFLLVPMITLLFLSPKTCRYNHCF